MNWEPETADPAVGSFLPYLRWAVEHTEGPVLELGGGYFSTPYLHGTGRRVVTYEGYSSEWCAELTRRFASPDHLVVSEFLAIPRAEWAVVLVDQEGWSRLDYLEALRPWTRVFVVHDSQDPWVPDEVLGTFAYRLDRDVNPRTTLVSNVVDVRECDA